MNPILYPSMKTLFFRNPEHSIEAFLASESPSDLVVYASETGLMFGQRNHPGPNLKSEPSSSAKWLDGSAFLAQHEKELLDWGVEQGKIQKKTSFVTHHINPEYEDEPYEVVHESQLEALECLGYSDKTPVHHDNLDEYGISQRDEWLIDGQAVRNEQVLLKNLAQDWAKQENLDGVWWNHRVPEQSSGVVFGSHAKKVLPALGNSKILSWRGVMESLDQRRGEKTQAGASVASTTLPSPK